MNNSEQINKEYKSFAEFYPFYLTQHQNITEDRITTDVQPAGIVPCTLAPRECSALLHRVELYASAE